MAYDDIAFNKQLKKYFIIYLFRNPYPGQVFNSPTKINYYKNVKIDYRGEDVTPQNFLAILRFFLK